MTIARSIARPIASPIASRTAIIGGGGGVSFDFYVDSVNGSNANDGLTAETAFATIGAVQTAALAFGNGVKISLAGGSYWRESLSLESLDNVAVSWDGASTPPVISGYDVQTDWVDDTATVAGRWYKDVAHNATGTNRQTVLDDGELMLRVSSAAAVTSAGTYFTANAGTANPTRVFINTGAENPNTNGHVYEVTTRLVGGAFGENANVFGVVFRGAISNNGAYQADLGSTATRCVFAYGTKHNALQGSGVMTDCVFYDADVGSASEASVNPLVVYARDQTGQSFSGVRLMFYNRRILSQLIFAHTLNDPADRIASLDLEQCIAHLEELGAVAQPGATSFTAKNCCFSGVVSVAVSAFADSVTIERVLSEHRSVPNQAFGSSNTGANVTILQSAVSRNSVSAGSRGFVLPLANQTVAISNCSYDSPADFFGQALGFATDNNYTISYNRCLIEANNALSKHANTTLLLSDNNVFVRPSGGGIGPFATWQGTSRNLSTAMANWRSDSGQDANSVALTSTPYTGNTAEGDFRVSAAATVNGQQSGVTEHWNFNTRQIVGEAPSRLARGPRTFTEAVAYISDPTAWNFYP